MPTTASPTDRRTELVRGTTTPVLIASAMMLDTFTTPDAETRATRSLICDELEDRFPEVTPALIAWSHNVDDDKPTYVETLLSALPELAVQA